MRKILITGTGTVARNLAKRLDSAGYRVNFLSTSRSYFNKFPCFFWDIQNDKIDETAFQDVEAIIHLAGAGIADKRWSNERKELLLSSRIEGANLIFRTLEKMHGEKPKVFISASGSNFYGTITQKDGFTEESPAGNDFLGDLCEKWENAAFQFEKLGMRTAVLRTGVVLSTHGGALPKLSKMVKSFVGSPVGNGKQIMPWIHIDDLTKMYQFIYENEQCNGAYNAVAPEKVCNRYFMQSLGKILHRPILPLGVPGIMLKAIYGEMADILLKGTHLINEKITSSGFHFDHPKLLDAIEDVVQNQR